MPLHVTGATMLGVVAWLAAPEVWWLALIAVLTISASFWVAIVRGRRRVRESEGKSEQLASQLDRRISELFSLQELSYVLSESIQLDRIVDQVASYAGRFLQADGAIVVLAEDEHATVLRVVAASGTLEPLLGQVSRTADTGLVRFAIQRERIEVAQGVATPTVDLIAGLDGPLGRGGAAPLPGRHHGRARRRRPAGRALHDRGPLAALHRRDQRLRRAGEQPALRDGPAQQGGVGDRLQRAGRGHRGRGTRGAPCSGPTGRWRPWPELPESELVGRNFCEMLFGSSEAVADLIEAAYRGERTAPLVVRLERNQRVLRLTAAPLAQRGSVVILVEDVTEQRILEAQLIQNDKMASIGQLVSGVAHELNNPLTSIAGLTELLLERDAPDLPREHLRVIHDQAERAGRIVRNLLTFARKGLPEKAAVDLNDVAARTSLLIVYELQLHGIELESALSPEPIVVLGDRYELQQVLLNLVTNAVQAVSGLPAGTRRGGSRS